MRDDRDENQPLVHFLEPDQFVADRSIPLARVRLSRSAKVGLWVLRVAAVVLGVMVIYVFVAALGQ